jgi:DNA anti-recombination protein RmuC
MACGWKQLCPDKETKEIIKVENIIHARLTMFLDHFNGIAISLANAIEACTYMGASAVSGLLPPRTKSQTFEISPKKVALQEDEPNRPPINTKS